MTVQDETTLKLRVGVDSGGTFTDVCMFDETHGEIHVWKVSSTPQDPSLGIAGGIEQGVAEVAKATGQKVDVVYFGHGTTVATNALIVGRGAETGLITTKGFRDVLELRRQKRDSLYDIQTQKPRILVTRDKRLEVSERVRFDGSIHTALDEDEVRAAARKLKADGITTVAVCFLFSFVEPAHEKRVKEILAEEMPGAFVSISHEVAPEFREYERLSTTVVNAYLGPIMKSYLSKLQPRLAEIGIDAHPHLTQSNGGVISSEVAQNFPARTVLSGPAAGVIGALSVGGLSGFDNIITFDMGGTSTDVSLIDRGRPQMSNDAVVHGYPLKLPMLDIHTVGAGGGSIAHIDAGGLLKVGPRSAAADPGPVCYGRGNEEPTVTDANVVLQVLNPTHLLNGRMKIDQARAKAAIGRLADQLGLGVMETAQGIISVVIANMAKAIRVISVERGYDPRDYVMLGFGGAGPIHAARLARELEIPRLVVPKYPGIMCALGLLLTDLRTNLSLTRLLPLSEAGAPGMESGFAGLEERGQDWFAQEAIPEERRSLIRSVDMRYGGQGYELTVPCPAGPIDAAALVMLRAEFERIHKQVYGYVAAEEPVQVTTLRIEAVGLVPKADLKAYPPASGTSNVAITGWREVWLPETGGFTNCPIYDRALLGPGHEVTGPAIIDQMDSTTLVLPGQVATVDAHLNLIIEG
ncbi:hydantoinase/oxoprolinase family protein [Bosea sp. SSUT16]|uniref:Hydantoinase/oxoprolinase family protein n=1 Tax=Bosea spartocytisi TaxID=2773451 RepID=A0A927E871_9HYPH|nr:hydantoinase/oxoprolinase family protein [Bosea spartocytisi]MBD3846032.1 hydantoinase/oxoprolinase family protein [Bosea spartocytisi]MCT4473216.1 hydantoinase/oxoprolinase family protein [Bosea spartocytisi]